MDKVTIGNATLYHADSREVLADIDASACITDPPWDAAKGIPGADDPRGLFADVVRLVRARRMVVQLGCDSDPVFLEPLAQRMPFLRTCWLEYACPSYKGRLLHTGDVAYAYGEWPTPRKGAVVIPGKCVSTKSDREFIRGPRTRGKEKGGHEALGHPMPRRLQHVLWLVNWFCEPDGVVLDPFMGSGTAGVASTIAGRPFVGIEVHKPFFDLACERIDQAQRQARLFA